MKKFIQFDIPLSGLLEGTHQFDYQIDKDFFNQFESSFITDGNVRIVVEFIKQPNVCSFKFEINGHVLVECDRCLEPYNQSINTQPTLLLKYSENPREEADVVYLLPNAVSYNLAQYIYEHVCLALPMRKVHPELEDGTSGCNPETIKYLDNNDAEDNEEEDKGSIWDQLNKLNIN